MDVSRYTNTKELRFTVEFVTPCFLGGPDGNAEIRTAPFKNLLRRWWRIARRSSKTDLSTSKLWEEESKLFGSKEMHGKSKLILKIISEKVTYEKPDKIRFGDDRFVHPEVDRNGGKVAFESYLGMGPIFGTEFQKSYIRENSNIQIALSMPNDNDTIYYIIQTLTLIDISKASSCVFLQRSISSRKSADEFFMQLTISLNECTSCFSIQFPLLLIYSIMILIFLQY